MLGHSNLTSGQSLSHLLLSIPTGLPLLGTGQVQGRGSVSRSPFESSLDAQELYFRVLNVALLVQSSELNA